MGNCLLFFCTDTTQRAQSTHDIMVGGGHVLIKTDIPKILSRAQIAVEGNYFVVRHFAEPLNKYGALKPSVITISKAILDCGLELTMSSGGTDF